MAKIKVYELAKELNVQSKDVLEFLESKKIEVKNHMSAVEDSAADQVKEHFGKAKKAEGDAGEAPKKKNIVHVFRPQNTQNGNKHGKRQSGNKGANQGRPMQVNNGRPAKGTEKVAEKPAEKPVEKPIEKTVQKTEVKEENKEKKEDKVVKNSERRVNNERSNSDRPARTERGDRNTRGDNRNNDRNDRGGRNNDRNDRGGRNNDRNNDRRNNRD
ncbi:MAG: translation initiation factor IF-2 N-terminal domain-containing protein, partial [Lachnospiraceae bacterium]|nr:translation initiation factor IF-2 N-terminal domain-containing protein [Lachnospiraceae bacterium]